MKLLGVMHSPLLLLVALAGFCGCNQPRMPQFEIQAAQIKLRTLGGLNHNLVCEFDARFDASDHTIELIERGEGNASVRNKFRGQGLAHASLDLEGTFVNDGDTTALENLKEKIAINRSGPVTLTEDKSTVLLEYTDLQGNKVHYDVRLVP